ncbi:MAG: 4Fe-4S binding protein [Elusimicrobia bacterium]|nr:4Fe-4S binding protein [Elusimicrobiota bacterium]
MAFSGEDEHRLPSALLFAGLILALTAPLSVLMAGRETHFLYALAWSLFTASMAFGIRFTGRTATFRRIFFAVSALAFLFHLKHGLFTGGRIGYCIDAAVKATPYCHISMASFLPERIHQEFIAAKIGMWPVFWGPIKLAAVWLLVTLAIGRAWCSWICCFGGINDGFCAIPRRPLLKLGPWAFRLRDLPAALLIFMLLAAIGYSMPVFCMWLCPLKTTTPFADPENASRLVQYALAFVGVVALALVPLLTGKKIFCAYLCPFSAWQALWGRLNPFRVSADPGKCVSCTLCTTACPMNAMKTGPEGKPVPGAYCNLCGDCVRDCPHGAMRYSIAGLTLPPRNGVFGSLLTAEYLYVFAALTLGTVFSALWGPAALKDLAALFGFN